MITKRKTRVLFGTRAPKWIPIIKTRIDTKRYDAVFEDLDGHHFQDFDLIVPLGIKDNIALATCDQSVRDRAIFPEPELVRLCEDKLLLNKKLSDGGFSDVIPRLLEGPSLKPPFILKKRSDAYGEHSHLIETQADVVKYQAEISDPLYFKQVFVPGSREFTTHLLVCDGQIIYHLHVLYEMSQPRYIKNKDFQQERVWVSQDNKYLKQIQDILDYLKFENGTCCFNYKVVNDRIKLFEINARFGSTLKLRINDYLQAYEQAIGAGTELSDSPIFMNTKRFDSAHFDLEAMPN